jgi:catechol 2,3-dioxygenase-like lactoylglutathione lyase family enzyme
VRTEAITEVTIEGIMEGIMDAAKFTPCGLDHLVLHVRDQDASRAFYVDKLGCTVDRVNARISLVHLRFGEAFIDLVPVDPAAPAEGGRARLDHFCLSIQCDDLTRLANDLRANGVKVEGDVVQRYGAFGTGPSLYLRDPDDYVVELKPR